MNSEFSSLTSEQALGIISNNQKNNFILKPMIKLYSDTKCVILFLMSSIFDPLGILKLFLLQPKHIVLHLRKQNINWNNPIPNSLWKQWELFKEDIQFISDTNIPRWHRFTKQLVNRTDLNVFFDASSGAYGAAVYVNYFSECSKKYIAGFLLLKSRLIPIK